MINVEIRHGSVSLDFQKSNTTVFSYSAKYQAYDINTLIRTHVVFFLFPPQQNLISEPISFRLHLIINCKNSQKI